MFWKHVSDLPRMALKQRGVELADILLLLKWAYFFFLRGCAEPEMCDILTSGGGPLGVG